MERNGFNPSSFETSGDNPDDSKEKAKTKKKKSAESAPTDSIEAAKKETVADRGKSLWEKLVGDDKSKAVPVAESSPADAAPELSEAGEDDPSLEELTPEEDAEITRRLVEHELIELESGRDEMEPAKDAAAREAAIAELKQMRDEVLDAESVEVEQDAQPELDGGERLDELTTVEPELADFDEEQTIPLTKPTPKPRPKATIGGSTGSPPPPPTPRQSGPSGSLPFGGGFTRSGSVENYNRTPVGTGQKAEYEPDYRVNPNATYLLVGGIVGYLIGRRRGRIKTEKRLAVVQRKLEKQVEAKQHEINEKTETVKKLARQNYEQTKQTTSFAERPSKSVEATPERRQAASVPEKVRAERDVSTPEQREVHLEKGIELSDSDVKRLSETITIGATNLRKIHEAKLVTDGGLRRLVSEHLQGKDIRRGLAREFLAKELSYERDPHFRDIVPLEATGRRAQGGGPVTDDTQVLSQPVALATTDKPQPQATPPTIQTPLRSRRSAVSTGMLSILSIIALALAAYAVWLGMSR